ncbi:tail fiber protein, partial [Citrobacter koseri]
AAAQKTTRDNIGLKGGATADLTTSDHDITAGRLLKVGDYGLGVSNGSVKSLASIYDITCSGEYNAMGSGTTSPTTGIPADSGNTRFAVYAGNIYSNQYLVTLTSNVHFYVGLVNTANKTATWSKFYNTFNKPSAPDVDAVSASNGGVFSKFVRFNEGLTLRGSKVGDAGMVGISPGSDAASFDGANLLLQSWYGIGFYSSFPADAPRGVMGYVDVRMGRLVMKEQIIPGNYANFDNRYQAKGNYTPAGQAYTKAESDGRFQPKG